MCAIVHKVQNSIVLRCRIPIPDTEYCYRNQLRHFATWTEDDAYKRKRLSLLFALAALAMATLQAVQNRDTGPLIIGAW